MLTGCLFENRVGVKIFGDTSDLISLHKTVRKITMVIVDYELDNTNVSNLLVDFLEDIEKAIHRNKGMYYGFQSPWIDLLIVSSLLRSLSEHTVTDDMDKINMHLLEYIIEQTALSVNKQDYIAIINYIEKGVLCVGVKQFVKGFDAIINNKYSYEKH